MTQPNWRELRIIAAGVLISALGWMGAAFVVYGFVSAVTTEVWPPLERVAVFMSSALTIAGTITTALSIYFFAPQQRRPENVSRFFTAPVVIACGMAALFVLIRDGHLSVVVVNGFALLAIAGGLYRIHPAPSDP
jgi:hypothetical protein